MGIDWLDGIAEGVTTYLDSLGVPGQTGRFLPCLKGATQEGQRAGLGFSCFALKVAYATGGWERLSESSREEWIRFVRSYQVTTPKRTRRFTDNAFADPAVMGYLEARTSWSRQLGARFLFPRFMTGADRVTIGESKQAIISLLQVGAIPVTPYRPYPRTGQGIRRYLARLDWTKPWAAGGQASALVTLAMTQGAKDERARDPEELRSACSSFFESISDTVTGGYFVGAIPGYDNLINGAMKVLTALDWLGVRVHFPEKLIDTCLSRLPHHDGCHLVDAIYVLYRCAQYTSHKRSAIRQYCKDVLAMIQQHYNDDGGFSYNIHKSQAFYYGVPISKGFDESDIHGTCLLTWAIAMIEELLERPEPRLMVIRP